jgi:hypothetical protein
MRTASVTTAIVTLLVSAPAWAGDGDPKASSLSIRPKIGALFPIAGDWDDVFDTHLHGELGLKGTLGPIGLEFSGGAFYTEESRDGADVEAVFGIVRFTSTYELNPLAARAGEANAYGGVGVGIYPGEVDAEGDIDEINVRGSETVWGWGPHVTLGGEYFLATHLGVFAEVQYTYILFEVDPDIDDADLHGFSLLAGLTLKF